MILCPISNVKSIILLRHKFVKLAIISRVEGQKNVFRGLKNGKKFDIINQSYGFKTKRKKGEKDK